MNVTGRRQSTIATAAWTEMTTVTLNQVAGRLEFSVVDDGAGFNPAAAVHGTGLQGMADRLSAVGGRLGIASAPGRGHDYQRNGARRRPCPGAGRLSSGVDS